MFGAEIADQRDVRPDRPVRDLAEFLRFLEETEEIFGPPRDRGQPWRATDYRL